MKKQRIIKADIKDIYCLNGNRENTTDENHNSTCRFFNDVQIRTLTSSKTKENRTNRIKNRDLEENQARLATVFLWSVMPVAVHGSVQWRSMTNPGFTFSSRQGSRHGNRQRPGQRPGQRQQAGQQATAVRPWTISLSGREAASHPAQGVKLKTGQQLCTRQ